eukprot:INCI14762.1.p1 GENE.INCI14762.1~~INCI14762.1.p1  ORF type:complete len:452 (-),score=92.01 INCI14762.1:144-1499(-)
MNTGQQVLAREFTRARLSLEERLSALEQSISVQLASERIVRKKAIEGCLAESRMMVDALRQDLISRLDSRFATVESAQAALGQRFQTQVEALGTQLAESHLDHAEKHSHVVALCHRLSDEAASMRAELIQIVGQHASQIQVLQFSTQNLAHRTKRVEELAEDNKQQFADETVFRVVEGMTQRIEEQENAAAQAAEPSVEQQLSEALLPVYSEIGRSDTWLRDKLQEIEFNMRVEMERAIKEASGQQASATGTTAHQLADLRTTTDRHEELLHQLEEDFRDGFARLAAVAGPTVTGGDSTASLSQDTASAASISTTSSGAQQTGITKATASAPLIGNAAYRTALRNIVVDVEGFRDDTTVESSNEETTSEGKERAATDSNNPSSLRSRTIASEAGAHSNDDSATDGGRSAAATSPMKKTSKLYAAALGSVAFDVAAIQTADAADQAAAASTQ